MSVECVAISNVLSVLLSNVLMTVECVAISNVLSVLLSQMFWVCCYLKCVECVAIKCVECIAISNVLQICSQIFVNGNEHEKMGLTLVLSPYYKNWTRSPTQHLERNLRLQSNCNQLACRWTEGYFCSHSCFSLLIPLFFVVNMCYVLLNRRFVYFLASMSFTVSVLMLGSFDIRPALSVNWTWLVDIRDWSFHRRLKESVQLHLVMPGFTNQHHSQINDQHGSIARFSVVKWGCKPETNCSIISLAVMLVGETGH